MTDYYQQMDETDVKRRPDTAKMRFNDMREREIELMAWLREKELERFLPANKSKEFDEQTKQLVKKMKETGEKEQKTPQ